MKFWEPDVKKMLPSSNPWKIYSQKKICNVFSIFEEKCVFSFSQYFSRNNRNDGLINFQ